MGGVLALGIITREAGRSAKFEASRSRSAATRSDIQGFWETYQKWGQDASTDYERSITTTKARMAASGVKAGSEQWDTNLANITSEYEKELEGFDAGVTGSALSDWAAQSQIQPKTYDDVGGVIDGPEFTPLSTTEYLTQEFGELSIDAGVPVAKSATDNARRAAAGGPDEKRTGDAGPTSSPWW